MTKKYIFILPFFRIILEAFIFSEKSQPCILHPVLDFYISFNKYGNTMNVINHCKARDYMNLKLFYIYH
jgi:hypothetical protein